MVLIACSALDKGAAYLQRVADTVASHMGMVCTILLCGPIAEHDARIECRGYVFVELVGIILSLLHSIHSGRTVSTGVKWNNFDPAAYQKVEDTMIKFAAKCFSKSLFHYSRASD